MTVPQPFHGHPRLSSSRPELRVLALPLRPAAPAILMESRVNP